MAALPSIALVTETWPPEINGVAMTLSRLVDGLRQRGHPVQVVRPRQPHSDETEKSSSQLLVPGAPIPGYGGLRFGLPVRQRLLRHWTSQRPEVIHIATEGPLGWAAMSVANRLGIPVTTSFHTQFHQYCSHYGLGWLRRGVSGYLRDFHNRALCTLVPSDSLRATLQTEGYRNLELLGRGIDTTLFHPGRRSAELRRSLGVDETTPVALYVGRLAPEKNLKTVLAAFEVLRARCPTARMVWVGDGPQLAKMQRTLPEQLFVGAKTGEELAGYYACADVFLFASLTETFGNVTLEAMASGLAVVAYRYAAAGQFLRHGINGLTALPGDNADFCELAAQLGQDWMLTKRLGTQACLDIQHVGWGSVLEQFTRAVTLAAGQNAAHD